MAIQSPPFSDYDQVSYPTMAHPQTFIGGLAVKALLRGMNPAPPENARILELGCGDGFNLAAMASLWPTASYVGIDFSSEAIKRGQTMMRELNVTQVSLEAGDIRSIDFSLGMFDYIIAHGVYSWVPEEVADALLSAVGRHLSPQGVAFISYLALPGAHLREMVRTMVRFHTRAESGLREKTSQARVLMTMLASATEETGIYSQWLKTEANLINSHTDEAFFHDELSDESHPKLFVDFLEHADRNGLRFLCEAEYIIPVAQRLTAETRAQLKPLEANRVLLEQYLDFLEGRRFRQTLLCRPGLGESISAGKLDQLFVAARGRLETPSANLNSGEILEMRGQKNSYLTATLPLEKAMLLELSAAQGGTLPFSELLSRIRSRLGASGRSLSEEDEGKLRMYLIRAAVPGMIEISWDPSRHSVEIPKRPQAHPFSRWALEQGAPAVFSYFGSFVQVEGELGRHLLHLLDGTRDREALLKEMISFSAERIEIPPLQEQSGCPPAYPGKISQQMDQSLRALTDFGLIARDDL